jgi:hypothetical protein
MNMINLYLSKYINILNIKYEDSLNNWCKWTRWVLFG